MSREPQSRGLMNHRLDRIDVLRGVAITLVVLHHFYNQFTQLGVKPVLMRALGQGNDWLFVFHQLGYLGVQLFFVLSGFCIHNSYLGWRRKATNPTMRSFLVHYLNRRFWRIYPPYFFALLLAFGISYWPVFDARAFRHLAISASLLNTLSPAFFYNINAAFWSVAIEWQLYMIYPVLLWLTRAWGPWMTTAIAASITVFWRFGLPHLTDSFALLHLPFNWWFEWCLGYLIADLRARDRVAFPRPVILTVLFLPLAVLALKIYVSAFLAWLLPPLAFAVLVQAVCADGRPLGTLGRLFCQIGMSSYSLYLLHNPLLWFVRRLLENIAAGIPPIFVWIPIFVLVFAVMQLVAWAMFQLIERPSIAAGGWIERKYLRRALPIQAVTSVSSIP